MTDSFRGESGIRLRRVRSRVGWTVGGLFLGGLVTLLVGRTFLGGLAPFDERDWANARQRWRAAGITDYRITVRVTGRQPAEYSVTVQGGRAIAATRDHSPLPQQRTWSTWTVEGMFETIARDLESVERHRTGRADSATPQLDLRGEFSPESGIPLRYHRTERVQQGSNPEVSWEVVELLVPAS